MSKKRSIVLLSPCLPVPDISGCAKVIYDRIRLLSLKNNAIFLFSFCSKSDNGKANQLKPYCQGIYFGKLRDYSRYPLKSKAIKPWFYSLLSLGSIDVIQCENAFMIRYVPQGVALPVVLTEHEILSKAFLLKSKYEVNPLKKIISYARGFKKSIEEKRWYSQCSRIIVFSQEDKDYLRYHYNLNNVEVIPLGIDLESYPMQPIEDKPYDLIFTGNFLHRPNVDAVLFFYQSIFPLIKEQITSLSWAIVGANPPKYVQKLAALDKNIRVTGYVENIADYYSKSKVAIVPIRYGGGMRYKVLEALALGVPVVSTSVGAKGLINVCPVYIADKSKDFANAVINLLRSTDLRMNLRKKGRDMIERDYDWRKIIAKYENIYSDLARKS